MSTSRRTQAARSDATRTALVAAAARLFEERGYADTHLADIVRTAAVSKGAFYHHFENKLSVFAVVFEETEAHLMQRLAGVVAPIGDSRERLRAGCLSFLHAAVDPSVQRIYLLDGPTVLGWEAVREIESRSSLALLRLAVEEARVENDPTFSGSSEAATYLLFGALCEAAMVIARSEEPDLTLMAMSTEIESILRGTVGPA